MAASSRSAQSLTGRFGQRARQFAWQFLRAGQVHFVASDAHDTVDRAPRLDLVCDMLRKDVGEQLTRQLLIEHPQAVTDNLDDPLGASPAPQPHKWYQIWRN